MHADERAIRELIDTWMRASAAHELDTLLGLMTPDVVFLQPGAQPIRGREAFAALQRQHRNLDIDARPDIREVRVCGEMAYCWNHLTVTIRAPDGSTQQRAGHVLSVLRKHDGRWMIERDANLLTAAGP